MTTRPYELLARFANDGSVSGVSVRTISTVNGRDYEDDPSPLSGATDPAFIAFAEAFAAQAVSERDQLLTDKAALESQLTAMTAERDAGLVNVASLQTEVARTADRDQLHDELASTQSILMSRDARIIELEAQLDALLNPPENPRHLAPYVFLSLLKPQEIVALQTSSDPIVIVGRSKLQTIITYIDLDNEETIGLARYMESIGLIESGRADQILSGTGLDKI